MSSILLVKQRNLHSTEHFLSVGYERTCLSTAPLSTVRQLDIICVNLDRQSHSSRLITVIIQTNFPSTFVHRRFCAKSIRDSLVTFYFTPLLQSWKEHKISCLYVKQLLKRGLFVLVESASSLEKQRGTNHSDCDTYHSLHRCQGTDLLPKGMHFKVEICSRYTHCSFVQSCAPTASIITVPSLSHLARDFGKKVFDILRYFCSAIKLPIVQTARIDIRTMGNSSIPFRSSTAYLYPVSFS